jgi:hypothetical protein
MLKDNRAPECKWATCPTQLFSAMPILASLSHRIAVKKPATDVIINFLIPLRPLFVLTPTPFEIELWVIANTVKLRTIER